MGIFTPLLTGGMITPVPSMKTNVLIGTMKETGATLHPRDSPPDREDLQGDPHERESEAAGCPCPVPRDVWRRQVLL
jgi:hypothetical protein